MLKQHRQKCWHWTGLPVGLSGAGEVWKKTVDCLGKIKGRRRIDKIVYF